LEVSLPAIASSGGALKADFNFKTQKGRRIDYCANVALMLRIK
jgi:hypothetical protein